MAKAKVTKKIVVRTPSTLKGKVDGLIETNNELTAEAQRLVRYALLDIAKSDSGGEGLSMDFDKFNIMVSLEGKSLTGKHKKDGSTLGHFTFKDVWQDKNGKTFRLICINPFKLNDMDAAQFFETCYHEAVHAYCDYIGQDGVTKDADGKTLKRDTSKNGWYHTEVFRNFGEMSGVLEITKKDHDSVGYRSKLSEKGTKVVKKLKVMEPSIFRIAEPKVDTPAKEKRVKLECSGCPMGGYVAIGTYLDNLYSVASRKLNSTIIEPLGEIRAKRTLRVLDFEPAVLAGLARKLSVQRCEACDIGMFPAENWTP